MTINKVNSINSGYSINKAYSKKKIDALKNDSFEVSNKAKKQIEFQQALKIVKASPDIRSDKIAQAKENMEKYFSNDATLSEEIANKIAEKLTNHLK